MNQNPTNLFVGVCQKKWYEESSGGEFTLSAFNRSDIMRYRSYLLNTRKYKVSTINRKIVSIRGFCQWAVNEGLLNKNPTVSISIKGLKDIKKGTDPSVLSKEEVFKLGQAVHRNGNKRDIALIELMLNTGLLVSEVSELKEENVEISDGKGILTIMDKDSRVRKVPVNTETTKYLQDYLEVRLSSLYLFVSKRGGKMSRSGIFRVIQKYANLAGIVKPVHPRTLRHTFAQTLIDNGTDLFTVQYLLGYKNINATQRYCRPKLEVWEQTVEDMYQ